MPKKKLSKKEAATRAKEYGRTLCGKLNFLYRAQVVKSRTIPGFPAPFYTFKQLKGRFLNDPHYIQLHKNWVDSGYLKQLAPSIDRTDSTKPYTFKNIQMMTWWENLNKQAKIDIHNSHDTPVAALVGENVIAIFKSQNEAIAETGAKNITKCLKGIRPLSAGFAWKSLRGISKKQFNNLKDKLPIPYSKIKFTPIPHRKNNIK